MSRTVFILGAGASAEAGGPLVADFIAKAKDIYRSGRAGDAQAEFELVFRARAKLQGAFQKSSLELDNIEELYAAFEFAALIGRLADLETAEVNALDPAMRRVITTTLNQSIKYVVSDDGQTLGPPRTYQAFVRLIDFLADTTIAPVSVVTFNYDVALDYALVCSGKKVNYFLTGKENSEDFELLKLHGSLNWIRSDDGAIVPVPLVGPNKRQRHAGALVACSVAELAVSPPSDSALNYPVIVPPTWNKTQHQAEYEMVWRRAAHQLRDAENIIVIGYSASPTDPFYRHLYALGTMSDTLIERYLAIGPEVGARHSGLVGGVLTQRGSFRGINEVFSQMYHILLSNLEMDSAAAMVSMSFAKDMTDLARQSRQ